MPDTQKDEIINLFGMVDELEHSYNMRLKALQNEYKDDVEEMLSVYKDEIQQFNILYEEQDGRIRQLKSSIKTYQDLYKKESVEHKITRDRLNSVLAELQNEQEMLSLVKERIEQSKQEIASRQHQEKNFNTQSESFAKNKKIFLEVIAAHFPQKRVYPSSPSVLDEDYSNDEFSY